MKARLFLLPLLVTGLLVRAIAGVEAVILQKADDTGNKAVIMRRNGEQYEIEYGIGALSISQFVGKAVIIDSQGLFLGIGSSIVLPGIDQKAKIWDSTSLGGGARSAPTLPSSLKTGIIEKEIALFDARGEAVAYIDTSDEMNIYLWTGEPVAYVRKGSTGEAANVYGFNGRHLGWFDGGIIRTHKGRVAGFVREAISNVPIKAERVKRVQRITPIKSVEKLEPLRPTDSAKFSTVPLRVFFVLGSKSDDIEMEED